MASGQTKQPIFSPQYFPEPIDSTAFKKKTCTMFFYQMQSLIRYPGVDIVHKFLSLKATKNQINMMFRYLSWTNAKWIFFSI